MRAAFEAMRLTAAQAKLPIVKQIVRVIERRDQHAAQRRKARTTSK